MGCIKTIRIDENFKIEFVSDRDNTPETSKINSIENENNPDIEESLFVLLDDWD